MGVDAIMRAVSRTLSSPALFGEPELREYRRADGSTLMVRTIVDLQTPVIEFAGGTSPIKITATVNIPREDLPAPINTGREYLDVVGLDGVLREAKVVAEMQVSASSWRLGVVF